MGAGREDVGGDILGDAVVSAVEDGGGAGGLGKGEGPAGADADAKIVILTAGGGEGDDVVNEGLVHTDVVDAVLEVEDLFGGHDGPKVGQGGSRGLIADDA